MPNLDDSGWSDWEPLGDSGWQKRERDRHDRRISYYEFKTPDERILTGSLTMYWADDPADVARAEEAFKEWQREAE